MPLTYLCQGCTRTLTRPGRCGPCSRADTARRTRKTQQHGRTTTHWQKLRRAVIARDGCCRRCGTTNDLTVHLDPRLHGDHRHATPDDCTTLCRRCHGSIDAPRAHRRF